MKSFVRLAFLMACLPLGTAIAGDFDGSKPLICAPVEAKACSSGGDDCDSELPADAGVPAFFRVDFAKKTIVGPKRTTPIQLMEKGDNQLLLQGTELGFGWSLALNSADGTMAGTILNRDGVVVLFGSCTPL